MRMPMLRNVLCGLAAALLCGDGFPITAKVEYLGPAFGAKLYSFFRDVKTGKLYGREGYFGKLEQTIEVCVSGFDQMDSRVEP